MGMIFIGIDPGRKGAIGIVSNAWIPSPFIFDLPYGEDDLVDCLEVRDIIQRNLDIHVGVVVCIEKCQAMPGQGVVSMFSYGKNYGMLLATLRILKKENVLLTLQEVSPVTWKKSLGLTKEKGKSIQLALDKWPQLQSDLITPRGALKDGRAEALLLAEYARTRWAQA